jgi:lipoprotein Spr
MDGFLCTISVRFICWTYILAIVFFSCTRKRGTRLYATISKDASGNIIIQHNMPAGTSHNTIPLTNIATGKITPTELLTFALSLKGIPYKYGSTDPKQGFDCSGFITYVFNHFGIIVPRRSVDFTLVNRTVNIKEAKPGDLILFTGTDSTVRIVGHMGIVLSNYRGELIFLHSTSGNADGVTETPFNLYYQERYIKTIRVFPQNSHF